MVDFVPAAYVAITVCSLAVVALYARAGSGAFYDYHRATHADQLIIGILISFGAGCLYFPYWIIWRIGPPDWSDALQSHWVIGAFAALYIAAALFHIRAASMKRCGERGWQAVAASAAAAAAAMLFIT